MKARVDHLIEDALRLPAEERSAVAAALIDSLEDVGEPSVPEAWRAELLKRRDDFQSGRVIAQPWKAVRNRLGDL